MGGKAVQDKDDSINDLDVQPGELHVAGQSSLRGTLNVDGKIHGHSEVLVDGRTTTCDLEMERTAKVMENLVAGVRGKVTVEGLLETCDLYVKNETEQAGPVHMKRDLRVHGPWET